MDFSCKITIQLSKFPEIFHSPGFFANLFFDAWEVTVEIQDLTAVINVNTQDSELILKPRCANKRTTEGVVSAVGLENFTRLVALMWEAADTSGSARTPDMVTRRWSWYQEVPRTMKVRCGATHTSYIGAAPLLLWYLGCPLPKQLRR